MKRALVDGAITKEAKRDPVFLAIFRSESQPGPERDMGSDDGVAAIHVVFLVEIMHRAAESARAAGGLPEKLGHAGVGAGPASQRVGVIAVSGNQVIIRPR